MTVILSIIAFLCLSLLPTIQEANAASEARLLPDEYESAGGHSLAFDNGGVAATGGLAAVKLNPAMLPMEQNYTIGGGYHWPSLGREFYQVGVVDTKTSNIGAGFSYTGFTDQYQPLQTFDSPDVILGDSLVKRRAILAFGQALKKLAVGINGQFIEAFTDPMAQKMVKGNTFGLGVAGLFTPSLRFGASAENLANKKVKNYAPRTVRTGLAWLLAEGSISIHLDYQRRDRIAAIESDEFDYGMASGALLSAPKEAKAAPLSAEQKVVASCSFKVYDALRLLAGYSHFLEEDRRSVAGGLAIVSDKVVLSYAASRPALASERTHQAVNLGLHVSL